MSKKRCIQPHQTPEDNYYYYFFSIKINVLIDIFELMRLDWYIEYVGQSDDFINY